MSEEFVSRNEFNTLKNEVQELKEEVGEYKQLLMQIDKKCDVITEKIANGEKIDELKIPNTYNNNVITSEPNLCITSTGKFRRTTNTSSKRYKKDIKLVEDDILNPERLYNLDIKQFKYKEEYQPNKNDSRYGKDLIGFIAEDVEKVFPIAVDYTEDENGNNIVDNWNERYIIPPMLKLIQNQKKKIDELEDRIKILEER